MKLYLLTFALGVATGGAGHWYFTQEQGRAQLAGARTNAVRFTDAVRTKAVEGYSDVKDELERTGMVVRDTARNAGSAVATAATDTRITTAVKTRLVGDSGLGGLSIGVQTSAGVVTLSGEVADLAQLTSAVNAALGVEGVVRVVSKLQVAPRRTP